VERARPSSPATGRPRPRGARATLGRTGPRLGAGLRQRLVEVARRENALLVVLEVQALVRRVAVLPGRPNPEDDRAVQRLLDGRGERDAAFESAPASCRTPLEGSPAALNAGSSSGARNAEPPWSALTVTFTSRGASRFTYAVNLRSISSGVWSGTSRIEIFALAREGMIVFAPSPWKPPQMPFTSSVGRAHMRSRTWNLRSPQSEGGLPAEASHSERLKGNRSCWRARAVSFRTRS
jgi:hypothetical protein